MGNKDKPKKEKGGRDWYRPSTWFKKDGDEMGKNYGYGPYDQATSPDTKVVPYRPAWERELELIDDAYVDDKYSAGQNYANRWYGSGYNYSYSWKSSSKESLKERFLDAMDEVARVVKLALDNDKAGKCVIDFKGGASVINKIADSFKEGKPYAALEPQWVKNEHEKETKLTAAVSDAYCGEALCQATLLNTSNIDHMLESVKVIRDKIKGNDLDIKSPLHLATERAVATRSVLMEWPGFAPYFKRSIEKHALDNGGKVEMFCAQAAGTADAIVSAAGFMLNNPGVALDVDDEILKPAAQLVGDLLETKKDERLNAVKKLVTDLVAKYGRYKSMGGGGGGGKGGGEGSGKGDAKGGGKGDKESDKGDQIPDMTAWAGDLTQSGDEGVVEKIAKVDPTRVRLPEGCHKPPTPPAKKMRGDMNAYLQMVNRLSGDIRRLKKALSFRDTNVKLPVFGCRSGDLDDGAVQEMVFVNDEDPAIWQRLEEKKHANVAVGILIDESGSMSDRQDDGSALYEKARDVAIIMAEAFESIEGLTLGVYGHSTGSSEGTESLAMFEYLSPRHNAKHGICHVCARHNNADGFAIEYVARRMRKDYPEADQWYVFVLSDGQPAAHCYGGSSASKHMKAVMTMASKMLEVEIYGIGIGRYHYDGNDMYGSGRFTNIDNVANTVDIVGAFLRKVFRK